VDPAALVGGPEHGLADGLDQPQVVVADDEPDPGQTAFAQVTQELGPERLGLAVADHHTQYLPAAVLGDPGGDHHGAGHDLVLDPGLAVGRVQIDVREADVVQWPDAERGQLAVQVLADPRDLALGDPGWSRVTSRSYTHGRR